MIGKPFSSIEEYLSQMAASMKDKLFFLKELPDVPTLYVDYGCADGTLINHLYSINSNNSYIGYDVSKEMINLAINRFKEDILNVYFTTNWYNVKRELNNSNLNKVLILSSVIHEVYSYCRDINIIDKFWKEITSSGFNYIVIRDMMPTYEINHLSNIEDVRKIRNNKNYTVQLESFENNFGSINYYKNLVHFLLKYRYKINWDREVHENYFPVYVEELLDKMSGYKPYNNINLFRVDFLDDCIKRDFNIQLDTTTHVKAIFKHE